MTDMKTSFRITLAGARKVTGEEPTADVYVPALPREGDHISHEPSGIHGAVKSVAFWWPEDGDSLQIEVRVR